MLAKIFSPFIKLWNWIKETAWIQPLLIVGIVFGIIFSISPIVKACGDMNKGEEFNFYKDKEVSMENIFKDSKNTEAVKLLRNIYKADDLFSHGKTEELKEVVKELPAEKFFLMFYSEECEACKQSADAFKYLEENWGKDYFVTNKGNKEEKQEKFVMKTINTLSKSKDEDDKEKQAFPELIDLVPEFFETTGSKIKYTSYYTKGKVDKTTLDNFISGSKDAFPVPTILLVDFTQKEAKLQGAFPTLTFNILGKDGGTGNADKAKFLMDCWNGDGDFGNK